MHIIAVFLTQYFSFSVKKTFKLFLVLLDPLRSTVSMCSLVHLIRSLLLNVDFKLQWTFMLWRDFEPSPHAPRDQSHKPPVYRWACNHPRLRIDQFRLTFRYVLLVAEGSSRMPSLFLVFIILIQLLLKTNVTVFAGSIRSRCQFLFLLFNDWFNHPLQHKASSFNNFCLPFALSFLLEINLTEIACFV